MPEGESNPTPHKTRSYVAGIEDGPYEVELSIIVPLYNEEENVPQLHRQVYAAVAATERSFELIYIDDGSTDSTGRLIADLARSDPRITAVSFRRNFGQTPAMSAGFDLARGRIIVAMDGDLQNDPNDIGRLLKVIDQGDDVVSGWRRDRHDHWSRVWLSKIANGLISRISGVRLHDYGCTLKAYRRHILQGIKLYGEMHRFIPIYAFWQGAKVSEIPVSHHARKHGKSKYGFNRIVKVMLDLVVIRFLFSYLTKPIYVFGGLALVSMIGSMLAGIAAIIFKIIPPDNAWGPTLHKDLSQTPLPLMAVGLLGLSVQLVVTGLLAEIMMRTYFEAADKRAYVVQSIVRGDTSGKLQQTTPGTHTPE